MHKLLLLSATALLASAGRAAPPPQPSFSVADVTVAEDAGQAVVKITKNGTAKKPSKVTFWTGGTGDTAQAPGDYAATNVTVSFGNTDLVKLITIPITDDSAVEGDEHFTVNIRGQQNAAIGQATATVTITDNDSTAPPQPILCWDGSTVVPPATCPPEPPNPPEVTWTVGQVLGQSDWWGGSTTWANFINGSDWAMQNTNPWGGAEDVPAQYLDSRGWLKALPPNYRAMRVLSIPLHDVDVECTYHGNGASLWAAGPITNIANDGTKLTFHETGTLATTNDRTTLYYEVDLGNYLKDLDCHAKTAVPGQNFDPELLKSLHGFAVLRFVKWTPSVEDNSGYYENTKFPPPRPTWATRNVPGGGTYLGNHDGVPVEVMVDLANQVGASPWFNMPWNASDDYVRGFAEYVRDHLNPHFPVYVEESNEVWNGGYWVYHQAAAEGLQEGLPSANGGAFEAAANRYGEKVKHTMGIWSEVFAGQMNRLVRLYCFQTVNLGYGEEGLQFALPNVDAYCTAPYWAFMQAEYTGQSLDQIMDTILPAKVAEQIDLAKQSKAIADKYHLRYVTYEGGQHVVLPNNVDLVRQIETDPRMEGLYDTYLQRWGAELGDEITLFAGWGPISGYGAWGLVEYVGQPTTAAPKMRSVQKWLPPGRRHGPKHRAPPVKQRAAPPPSERGERGR